MKHDGFSDSFRQMLIKYATEYYSVLPEDVLEFSVNYFSQLPDINTMKFIKKGNPNSLQWAQEQIIKLKKELNSVPLFNSLDAQQLIDMIHRMDYRIVKAGTVIVKQGENGDYFFVVGNGKFEARVKLLNGKESPVHSYDNKGSFGELALLYNLPRAASVIALTDGSVFALDRFSFKTVVLKNPLYKKEIFFKFINKSKIFQEISLESKKELSEFLIEKKFKDKECIFNQNDIPDGIYFLEEGRVRLTIILRENEIDLKTIEKGSYFGELAVKTHQMRANSAYAIGQTKVYFLDIYNFERLLDPIAESMLEHMKVYDEIINNLSTSNVNI